MRPPAPHGGPSDNNTPRQPKLSINKKPRLLAGFFVYRHLGQLGCNIVLMKRFLPPLRFKKRGR